ncbi:MAG: flagellar hook-associated protein FlgK [Lachnospiraceae bacterium]|nr:flagellar hook-associated protein FlgK [Butyrivibrio sp.]MCM1342450.1 flagellar hook-associated protein FlgK [Muribaculaceae bacterium]MCM1410244.1 flagellar hook-associated protein FlgK [Lachnospiraceae bacterium]
MGSLYIGASGLQTSQNALNTTAHNLSNIDTPGYTRQQVQLATRSYLKLSTDPKSVNNKQTGIGVSYSRVKYVRDYFLDQTYRKESGRSMFYEVSTGVLEEIESQLGEMNGEAFQTTMEDLWTAIEELAKDPASSITQGVLVQRSSEFIERAAAVYDGLVSYQDNLNTQIKQQIDKINKYGQQLLVLNDRIRAIECGGIEHANDLQDARNSILDELSQLASMSYEYDIYGSVSVKIEGVDFVKSGTCYEIGLYTDETTGFYTPFWPTDAKYRIKDDGTKEYDIDGAEVFDLEREISSDLDTDIGGIRAMLYARGDHRADYTDLDPSVCTQKKLEALGITEEEYSESYGRQYYDECISNSILMNIQGEFDQMVHSVVTKINDILMKGAGVETGTLTYAVYNEDGTTSAQVTEKVRYCEVEPDGYLRDSDGIPLQMFTKITTAGYTKVKGDDGKDYYIFNEEDGMQPDSIYAAKNLQVNPILMQEPAKLGFRKEDGSEDQTIAEELKAAFQEKGYTLNPNVTRKTTFIDYYTDLVNQVGSNGFIYRGIYENQQAELESIDSSRQQVVGVSSDEELSNMIKFQNAYNASSRYINVISEMLEHIINTLGV